MIRPWDDRAKTLVYDTSWSGDQLMSPYRVTEFSWAKCCMLALNPVIASTLPHYARLAADSEPKKWRDVIPLWSFYNPADTPVKLRKDGMPSSCASNMRAFHCLQIDYDDGAMTIDAFMRRWSRYTYLLYTTPSYDGSSDRYRVVMPLATAVSPTIFDCADTRSYMTQHIFTTCDASTVNTFRKQRIPAIRYPDSPYRCHINVGRLYDLPRADLVPLRDIAVARSSSTPSGCQDDYNIFDCPIELLGKSLDGAIEYAHRALSAIDFSVKGGGIVNATMLRVNAFLTHAGVSKGDRRQLLYSYTGDAERRSSIDRMIEY